MDKNKFQIRLSPSSVQCFRRCPLCYKLSYIDRIKLIREKEALRQGTNWHALFEIAHKAPEKSDLFSVITNYLDKTYEVCPDYIRIEDWEQEKFTLLYSFLAYCNHYQEPQNIIASEIKFEFPLRHPRLRHEISDCVVTGRIDTLIQDGPRIKIKDYKTTSWDIGPGSDFWQNLERQIQPRLYVYALHRMIERGEIEPLVISEVEYDVFKKPGIRPKKIAKKDLITIDKELFYYDTIIEGPVPERETGSMFGARLFNDIVNDPFKYFVRRPITVLAQDIESIEQELYNVYKLIKYCKQNNFWDIDPYSCSKPFKCEYCLLCDQHIDPDKNELPDTYKRGY